MKFAYLKPADGLRVLDPGQSPPTPLPSEGRRVELSSYWLRRLKAGEVVQAPEPEALIATAEAKKSGGKKE